MARIHYDVPEPGDAGIDMEAVRTSIEEWEESKEFAEEEGAEEFQPPFSIELYQQLKEFADGASGCDEAIADEYFLEYITQIIDDCYDIPKNASGWPYRHIKVDYEAAAEEAKQDYTSVEFGGVTYWCLWLHRTSGRRGST